jgi:hypothetical protein
LAAGLTKAIRFFLAGCCARAAIDHIAALPSKSVMKSRHCMYPPEETRIDTSTPTLATMSATFFVYF